MMVIDTSAIVAILAGEPEGTEFNEKIAASTECFVSAATYVEAHIVIAARSGEAGTRELALYLHEAGMTVVPVDRDQADIARTAYRTFGNGRHSASLNVGDCFSYALAKRLGAGLLYKGEDFARTDLIAA